MFERERKVFGFSLGLIDRLMADVSDDELSKQPVPGMNPPRWILGHLAISTDFCLRLLGAQPALPQEWHAAFAPGSKHNVEGAPRPTKAELLAALKDGNARVLTALDAANEADLARPHNVVFESLEKAFPTRGDLLANMMTAHGALHIGQLSAWRRASGRPPLF